MSLISNLFSTINRQQFDGQHVMNQNGGGRRIEKRDQQQSQRSYQARSTISHQSPSPNKMNQTSEGQSVALWWCLGSQHESLCAQYRSQKFDSFCWGSYFVLWWDWRIRRRWLRKTPFARKFKVNASKTIQVICSIFWASLYFTESHQKMKTENSWLENKYNNYCKAIFNRKLMYVERIGVKIVYSTTFYLFHFLIW